MAVYECAFSLFCDQCSGSIPRFKSGIIPDIEAAGFTCWFAVNWCCIIAKLSAKARQRNMKQTLRWLRIYLTRKAIRHHAEVFKRDKIFFLKLSVIVHVAFLSKKYSILCQWLCIMKPLLVFLVDLFRPPCSNVLFQAVTASMLVGLFK